MISMLVLVIFSIYFIANNGLDILIQNWKMPLQSGGIKVLILGIQCCDARGILSGFESSANFVENKTRGFSQNVKKHRIAVSF